MIFFLRLAATQIHSSLLSLSVGAVLLPAAFHFTLSSRDGSDNMEEQIDKQKQDILRMSHGVSFNSFATCFCADIIIGFYSSSLQYVTAFSMP